jgi:hypothetical protein
MKSAGTCRCPRPCHGWAAATTDPDVITSDEWTPMWRTAAAVAYHPGGAGLTVVDLDDEHAITWARETLPATRTAPTTRGEHWIYRGVMRSVNAVRDGVDIKSTMAYARWLGPGKGAIAELPEVVRALTVKNTPTVQPAHRAVTGPSLVAGGQCPEARNAIHTTVYRTFLAVQSVHGRCGCLTEAHVARLFAAAQAKGESARHCTDAWTNARTALGM